MVLRPVINGSSAIVFALCMFMLINLCTSNYILFRFLFAVLPHKFVLPPNVGFSTCMYCIITGSVLCVIWSCVNVLSPDLVLGVYQLTLRQSTAAGCVLFLSATRSMSLYTQLFPRVPWVIWPDLLQVASPMCEWIAPDSCARNDSLGEIESTLSTRHIWDFRQIDLKVLF